MRTRGEEVFTEEYIQNAKENGYNIYPIVDYNFLHAFLIDEYKIFIQMSPHLNFNNWTYQIIRELNEFTNIVGFDNNKSINTSYKTVLNHALYEALKLIK